MSKSSFHFLLLLHSLLAISSITAGPILRDTAHEDSLLQRRSAEEQPPVVETLHDYVTTVHYHQSTWEREGCNGSNLNCALNPVAPQVCSSDVMDFYPAEARADNYFDKGCLLHFEINKEKETQVTGLDFSLFARPVTKVYAVYLIHYTNDPRPVSTKFIDPECSNGWQIFHAEEDVVATIRPGVNKMTILLAALSSGWASCSELRNIFYIDTATPFNKVQRREVPEPTTEPGPSTTELPTEQMESPSKEPDPNNKDTPTAPSQTDKKPEEHSETPTDGTEQPNGPNEQQKATASPKGKTQATTTSPSEEPNTTASPKGKTQATTASPSEKPNTTASPRGKPQTTTGTDRPTDTTTAVSESTTTEIELPILTLEQRNLPIATVFLNNVPPYF